ncbi:MAG: YihA family ribosome biogenesis GTP-binding protein [Clostridia bacterium]|nr:YihA family ribosome biogenesis GTP-binding protein [Oscillospiraceae bacterium]MBP3599476.1 YihA family ribosome biogenesis GTP-binding protein [Clostridia bacterium]
MNYNNAQFEKAYATLAQLDNSDLPELCFSGRSNVGKSSLINKVLGRKSIARVSSKPGKTITINFYKVDNIRLVDLPGYGYAKVAYSEKERWAELMEGYFGSGRNIKMVFQLIDMRHPATEFDISMLEFLRHNEIPYTVILTKADKLNKSETENRLRLIYEELGEFAENTEIIPFSIQNAIGVERVREIISSFC